MCASARATAAGATSRRDASASIVGGIGEVGGIMTLPFWLVCGLSLAHMLPKHGH
jgi:hypothetical protein